MATIESKQKALGSAPVNSVLEFSIEEEEGFTASARLFLDGEVDSKWKSEAIIGKTKSEPLELAGAYRLELTIAMTSKTAMDVTVDVSLTPDGDSDSAVSKQMTFTGKKAGDVCEALAVAVIV